MGFQSIFGKADAMTENQWKRLKTHMYGVSAGSLFIFLLGIFALCNLFFLGNHKTSLLYHTLAQPACSAVFTSLLLLLDSRRAKQVFHPFNVYQAPGNKPQTHVAKMHLGSTGTRSYRNSGRTSALPLQLGRSLVGHRDYGSKNGAFPHLHVRFRDMLSNTRLALWFAFTNHCSCQIRIQTDPEYSPEIESQTQVAQRGFPSLINLQRTHVDRLPCIRSTFFEYLFPTIW